MRSLAYFGLAGAVVLSLVGACRQDTSSEGEMDMALRADLGAAKKATSTTIRELNAPGGPIALKSRVKLSGVVISPLLYTEYEDNSMTDDWCRYRLAIMQADGSAPTLRDGMTITIRLRTMFSGDMSKLRACDELGKQNAVVVAMDGLKMGDLVEIEGTFLSAGANGSRFIDVYGGRVVGMGPAPMQPLPVHVDDPTMFGPNPADGGSGPAQAFIDACGVLVEFSKVKVTARNPVYQDFSINTTDMGGAAIAANYLRIVIKNYMSPAVGTMLQSVTGIVYADFGGKIWPRTAADIK